MAGFDRFLIAPINTGMHTYEKPWLIPNDAFERLLDVYEFRGRIRKRFGSFLLNGTVATNVAQQYSRFRINIGMTPGPLNLPNGVGQLKIGQMFSVGDDMFTVWQLGAGVTTLSTNPAITATINSTTNPNTIVFVGAPAGVAVYYYPANPVMGLLTFEIPATNNSPKPTYGFDTQFAYFYSGAGWERLGTAIWTGSNSQFFWGATWRASQDNINIFFTTNFNTGDPIRYWDGTNWIDYQPVLNPMFRLRTSLIILPFKDRLLFLNTWENNEGVNIGTTDGTGNFGPVVVPGGIYQIGQAFLIGTNLFTVISSTPGPQAMQVSGFPASPTNPNPLATGTFDITTGTVIITGNGENPNQPVYFFPLNTAANYINFRNRLRFTQNGNALQPNAMVDTIAGKGGFIDCPIQEAITSAEFIKDRLIVFFQQSTWEIVYTGNEILPFRWQQINTELGVESTFSVVPFDKVIFGIDNVGIHECNGQNVQRIDQDIPDVVFEIHNENDGTIRVYGIRDYFVEMVYWAFPDPDTHNGGDPVFPTRVLVYNYRTGSWALNNDSITVFGYFQNTDDRIWLNATQLWDEALEAWNDGAFNALFRQIIAGNQEGFTFIVDSDTSRNAPALQITNMTFLGNIVTLTVINHNLTVAVPNMSRGDYIIIENAQGITDLNGLVFPVNSVVNLNTITLDIGTLVITGVYTGGGTIARVSGMDILTKQYNFYNDKGRNAYIPKVDFLVDKTEDGEITVDYYPSSTELSMVTEGQGNGSILGTSILETSPYLLYPLEQVQTRLWHPIYLQTEGECIQLRLYLSDEQIRNTDISWSDFELNAMLFYATPTSQRFQ